MKKLLQIYLLLFFYTATAQQMFTITGIIKDAESGETLNGVSVIDKGSSRGTYTNEYGFYSFTLSDGEHEIEISYMGYTSVQKKIVPTKNIVLNISLNENIENLNEILVTTYTERVGLKKAQMSVHKMKVKTIKSIPAALGEVDVLKSITTLPGVSAAAEGQTGFNVRGGATDQNLVLLDEATLYNPSHLFGYFSVINADAIKNLKLYKGGIPAKYGGRISSVLDIHQKDGNKYKFHGNGGVGLLSSRLTLEGPIVKNKASFFISGRRSYADAYIPIIIPDGEIKAYFYDLNTKINWEVDAKNKLYLSGYFGRDILALDREFATNYGNAVANFRWNHVFNSKLFSNLSLIYSNYYFGLDLNTDKLKWDSGLENYKIKYDLKHYKNNNIVLNYGLQSIAYVFNPGNFSPDKLYELDVSSNELNKEHALENNLYLDVEHRVNDKINLRYGIRWSSFMRFGNNNINIYENNQNVTYDKKREVYEQGDPIEKINSKNYSVGSKFGNLEPRLSITYSLNNSSSIKASYQNMMQYIHVITNTQSSTPLNNWTPSGNYIDPQNSNQIALGYNNFLNKMFSVNVEIFGKTVANRIDYIDGVEFINQEAIESVILNGKARSYGMELMLKKEHGKFTGWVAYTLSKAEQQTKGRTPIEVGINNGNWYPTSYDRTHDLSVVAIYEASKKWKFSSNFTLQSGQPLTDAIASYNFLNFNVPSFGPRNSSRLPSYHRLDISASYTPKASEEKKWKGEWVFGIYNLYNRENISEVSFLKDTETQTNTTRNITLGTTIFGLVPSIAFNFKF